MPLSSLFAVPGRRHASDHRLHSGIRTHPLCGLSGGAVAADAQSVQLTRQMLMIVCAGPRCGRHQPAWERGARPGGPTPAVLALGPTGRPARQDGYQGRMRWCPGRSLGPAESPSSVAARELPLGPGSTYQGDEGGLIASSMAFRSIRRPHVVVVTCRAARSSAGLVRHASTSMGNDVTPCQLTVTSSPLPTSSRVSS